MGGVGEKKMNKRTSIAAGLLSLLLIGTVSAAVLTAAQDNTGVDKKPSACPYSAANAFPSPSSGSRMVGPGHRPAHRGLMPYESYLTAAQQAELNATIQDLRQHNATPREIQTAIQAKLDSFGVFDAKLNDTIAQTQQQLAILQREQALRSQGYNWTTIDTMIRQEFGENSTAFDPAMPLNPDHCPRYGGRPDFRTP